MCGIFGVHGHPDAVQLAQLGLYSLQHRGQESVGLAAFDANGGARVVRAMGTITPEIGNQLNEMRGTTAVGHTRYSTAGSSTLSSSVAVTLRVLGMRHPWYRSRGEDPLRRRK